MTSVLLVGCYTLRPSGGVVPALGAEIGLDLNDAGRVALGGSMGPEIGQIEGRLMSKDDGAYVVAVSAIHLLRGGEQVWRGERVSVKTEYVTTVYEKRFSRGRSIALGALGVGAAAIIGTQTILGGGQRDPTAPTDTVQSDRRKRP